MRRVSSADDGILLMYLANKRRSASDPSLAEPSTCWSAAGYLPSLALFPAVGMVVCMPPFVSADDATKLCRQHQKEAGVMKGSRQKNLNVLQENASSMLE